MYTSHTSINHQNEKCTPQQNIPADPVATKDYTRRVPVNLNDIFVSKVSRTFSLDSSIPIMPSMVTTLPVHDKVASSSKSYMPSSQQTIKEKSVSRSNSGASIDMYYPGDVDHNGKEDKLPLHGGLKNPIWVTPTICTHQGSNGEMCYLCRNDMGKGLERKERNPDFTVLNVYRRPTPAKKCKCGTITTLTICFSVVVIVFLLAFVIYEEVFIRQQSHYKM